MTARTSSGPSDSRQTKKSACPSKGFCLFGAGAHGCVGGHLALMEGHLLTAVLAQRVRFHLPIDDPIARNC